MANERNTENLVRNLLRDKGFYSDIITRVEEQQSEHADIQRRLERASKSGEGVGRPEFIISREDSNTIIVIECKADPVNHKSETLTEVNNYAVDGAIHYAKHLSTRVGKQKAYDVIAIGVSGETEDKLVIDTYTYNDGAKVWNNEGIHELRTFDEYHRIVNNTLEKKQIEVQDILDYASDIHEFLYEHVSLPTGKKMLLLSGVLLSLQDDFFEKSFEEISANRLVDKMVDAIKDVLSSAGVPKDKKEVLMHNFNGLKLAGELSKSKTIKKGKTTEEIYPILEILRGIDEHVIPIMKNQNDIDVMGRFYGEFIKYTVGDGKDGFVLTPQHITNLFAELGGVGVNTKVLDTCTGTGGLLIAAMSRALKGAKGCQETEQRIKKENLHGVEMDPDRFALACTNMILRGDGQSNLIEGSCLSEEVLKKLKKRECDIGLINPPYSLKGTGQSELDFIEKMLDSLVVGGTGVAIVPMSVAIDTRKGIRADKERIMGKHTLEAVMSMPDDLFYPVGVVTCIMVFTAHKPHDSSLKSWFGYWKDDGHEVTRKGRLDTKGLWENEIKDKWLKAFRNRDEIIGFSVRQEVTAGDEWCAENYMETDYSTLTEADFEEEVKKYAIYKLMNE